MQDLDNIVSISLQETPEEQGLNFNPCLFKKIKNRSIISLIMIMSMGLAGSMLHGMETNNDRQKGELAKELGLLPQDVQTKINKIMLQDSIAFLANQPLNTLKGYAKSISAIGIDGDKVVIGERDGNVTIVNLNSGKLLLKGHTESVKKIAIDVDVVITESDRSIEKIWDIHTGELLYTEDNSDYFSFDALTDDKGIEKKLNEACIWDIHTGELLYTLTNTTITSVAAGGDKVVIGSYNGNGNVTVWSLNTGELLYTLERLHTSFITSIAIDGDKVATGSYYGIVKVFDLKSGNEIKTIKIDKEETKLFYKRHGVIGEVKTIVPDSELDKAWRSGTVTHFYENLNPLTNVAIAGDKIATVSSDHGVQIWLLNPYAGRPEDNPLAWIIYHITVPQADFIQRAYQAGQKFNITFPGDAEVFLGFPRHVQQYLIKNLHLTMRKK